MNLKYPYEEEFKNNLLSSISKELQENLQMTLSDLVPNSKILRKLIKSFDKQEYDIEQLATAFFDSFGEVIGDSVLGQFFKSFHGEII